jgi:hypothetical protein
MTHVRTQIRQALKAALDVALPTFDVYASRKYAKNITAKPIIDMRFLNENIDSEVMGSERRRKASLYVRVQRHAAETEIDDLLDDDEIAINDVVMSDWWESFLTEPPEQMQVNWSDTDQGGAIIGSIVLRYDVEYRVDQSDFETVR